PLARRLELFLLLLPFGDLPNDHQELVIAARSEASFIVAPSVLEVEVVLDYTGVAAERRASRLEHPVGQVDRQSIPEQLPDDLVVHEVALARRVVRDVPPVAGDPEHQVRHRLQQGAIALCTCAYLDEQLVSLEGDPRRIRDPLEELRLLQ